MDKEPVVASMYMYVEQVNNLKPRDSEAINFANETFNVRDTLA